MTTEEIIQTILKNRGLVTLEDQNTFFSPIHPEKIPPLFESEPAIQLIKHHIQQKNSIAIYGDYDVDGVSSTAILWETIYKYTHLVFPHIPHRKEEGYGLSQRGIDKCLEQNAKLIITIDNGIVANQQVQYARDQGCDVIIIDHHEASSQLPNANVILHSTQTCASVLAWLFVRDFLGHSNMELLGLAALGVICDMIPLLGLNRSVALFGLNQLRRTNRPGLLALYHEAGFTADTIDTYKVGFLIGPRLNAMGRLEHALDSLRLLCIKDPQKASQLAQMLGETNRSRQELTQQAVNHALTNISVSNVIVTADSSYEEGIIGLIASKLVEKYYRPVLAISIGSEISKGSARSIAGFDITNHLRQHSHLLTAVGGHQMAAGFSLHTKDLPEFISSVSNANIPEELLTKKQRIDCQIPTSAINNQLWFELQKFAPFGLGNPQPVFSSQIINVKNLRKIGQQQNHLKMTIDSLDAIWFNFTDANIDSKNKLIYSLSQNTFNQKTTLQLLIKDLQ